MEKPTGKPNYFRIIRKSVRLLIVRIVSGELLLEMAYLSIRFFINTFPLDEALAIDLNLILTVLVAIFFLLQIMYVIAILMEWSNTYYELQDDEMIVWRGVFSKTARSYPYTGMQSITVQQSLWGRIMGFGTVTMYIPVLGHEISLTDISHPMDVAELLKSFMKGAKETPFLLRKS